MRKRNELAERAEVFAALGDPTRLALVRQLAAGPGCSISALAVGSKLTRQAITKHLGVLKDAGLVHNVRSGRENVFKFDPRPLMDAKTYLEQVSSQWDDALLRLKKFVE